jgi:hypothetical protein
MIRKISATNWFCTIGIRADLKILSVTLTRGEQSNTHRIYPVNVDITEVTDLKRGFSARGKTLGIFWRRAGEGKGKVVYGWWLAETEKGVAKFGCGLTGHRNGTQVMGHDGALLGKETLANIIICKL